MFFFFFFNKKIKTKAIFPWVVALGRHRSGVVAACVGLPLRNFGLRSLLYVIALARCFRSVRRVVVAVLGLR